MGVSPEKSNIYFCIFFTGFTHTNGEKLKLKLHFFIKQKFQKRIHPNRSALVEK